MKSIRSSIISLVHVTVFFLHVGVSSLPAIFAQHFKFLEFKFFDRVYHTRNLNQKTWTDLDGIEMHPIFFQLGWNLDGDWPIRRQNPYQHQGSCIPGLTPNEHDLMQSIVPPHYVCNGYISVVMNE
jgi:hypothetical protein